MTTQRLAASVTDETTIAPPKRMTLSHVVELLLTRCSAERSYVTLTRNAKGDTQIDVKVQTTEHGDIQTVEDAETKALEVYNRLVGLHPAGGTQDQTTVELSRNAKGDTQVSVQVRTGEAGDVQTCAEASGAATKLYDDLREKYPIANSKPAPES